MRIFADRLADQLSKQLHPIYLLFGNEPLLLQESRQAIQQSAKQQGLMKNIALPLITVLIGT